MKILSYIFLIFYLVFLTLNSYTKTKNETTKSSFFKILLMPTLFLYYITTFEKTTILIFLALFFSWMGDVFLIKTRKKDIIFGILSFSLTHIIYIIYLFKYIDIKSINYIFIIILSIFYFGISIFVSLLLTKSAVKILKNYKNIIFVYGSLLSLLSIFSVLVGINTKTLISITLILGSNLFMLSDTILSYNIFVKKEKLTDILIMLTYGLAQLFIVLGLSNLK